MNRIILALNQMFTVMYAHKARTLLSVVGIMLGAASLVTVQNVAKSFNLTIYETASVNGDKVFTIYARVPYIPGSAYTRKRVTSMKIADADDIKNIDNVVDTAGAVRRPVTAKYKDKTIATSILGTTVNYFPMRKMLLKEGRYFTENEDRLKSKVALLGSEVAKSLFDKQNPIGEEININNDIYTVIGVFESKGADSMGNSFDEFIAVPLKTAMVRVLNRDYLNNISVQINSWDAYNQVQGDVKAMLRIRHSLGETAPNDFDIINPLEEQKMVNSIVDLAVILGKSGSGIAFLIGGVGVFSLMLLIVYQRMTEIGIKRAIGATRNDILLQFILESGFIGLVGGAFGVFIGLIVSFVAIILIDLVWAVSILGLVIGFLSAFFVGAIAGIYPALKASKVTPIKALKL